MQAWEGRHYNSKGRMHIRAGEGDSNRTSSGREWGELIEGFAI